MGSEGTRFGNNRTTDQWAARKIFFIFFLLFASLVAVPVYFHYQIYVVSAVAFVTLGVAINKVVFIMHECAHGTLFTNKDLERKVGWVCGLFLVTDFTTFKSNHLAHHSYFGLANDPQGSDYNGFEGARFSKLLWHLVRPALGLNLFKLKDLNKNAKTDKKANTSDVRTFLLCAGVVHLGILFLATLGGKVWLTFPCYHLAAGTVGLFLSQTRGFAEHISFPGGTTGQIVRTHYPNILEGFFLYDFNFNYHVEHHLNPNVPAYYLPGLSESMKGQDSRAQYSKSIVFTILKRLKQSLAKA